LLRRISLLRRVALLGRITLLRSGNHDLLRRGSSVSDEERGNWIISALAKFNFSSVLANTARTAEARQRVVFAFGILGKVELLANHATVVVLTGPAHEITT
jgi:DNA repair exonuclease SbcCD nuclease subunit